MDPSPPSGFYRGARGRAAMVMRALVGARTSGRSRTHLEYYNFGLGRRNLGRRAAAAQGMTHQWRKFAPAHTKAALHASARGTHLLGQQRLARIAK